jgi:hypothetical protein
MHHPTDKRTSPQAADQRIADLAGGRVWPVVALGTAITVVCTVLLLATSYVLTSGDGPRALSNDFRVFWAAGQMALQGDFLGVFDTDKLAAVHDVSPEFWMPWLYPPGFLFAVAPLGAVSFATAFTIMSVLSLGLMAAAVRPFTGGSRAAWAAFSLSPAYLPILVQGQNGLIWLAGLVAAFAALRHDRPILAGIFIGLLTLKPQYGLLIPVALVAAGYWRTILSASATALVISAVPTIWTGLDYWTLFIRRLGEYGDHVSTIMPTLDLAAGPFAFFVRLGIPSDTAILLHAGIATAAALCVFLVWRSRAVGLDTKAATLLIAIFLAPPLIWYNEAAIMALVGLFMVRAGILTDRPWHLLLLFILWLGAGLQSLTIFVGMADWHFPWALLVTPVLLLCLVLCVADLGTTGRPLAKAA